MHYIAMDSHISTLDFAVIDEGDRVVKQARVPTSAKNMIAFIQSVRQPRTVFMEEGTLAAWSLETCDAFGEHLVITDPKRNRWIGASQKKDDRLDALKLARLARGGFIKEIPHPVGDRRRFRELMIAYHDNQQSQTRVKNKLKGQFRHNGIPCPGSTVYSPRHRQEWIARLPADRTPLLIIEGLWMELDSLEKQEAKLLREARVRARGYPEIKLFMDLPGVGFITAATVSAILGTPHRFADKRKVWAYSGFGISRRSSGSHLYSEKLDINYNRLLKYAVKQAAEAAVRGKDNPFRQKYLEMTMVQGIARQRAILTIARIMLATMLAMWRNGVKYDPKIRNHDTQRQARA